MQTSEEVAYHKLRELIVDNQLPKGEFLSQRKLASSVGATLSTIRSSLRRLENDGLIENVPKWGVRIPEEDENMIRDRYFLRELFEVGAVERMLEKGEDGARKILQDKAQACDEVKLVDAESFKDFALKHLEFHLAIAHLSGSDLLPKELARLNFRSMMLSNSKNGWELHNENQNETYHRDFVDAVFELPLQEALAEVRTHVRRGCAVELATLRRLKQAVN